MVKEAQPLVQVKDLVVRFYTYEGVVKALSGVNLDIKEGETLGLVGETGCGKSVTAFSIIALPPPPGKIEKGDILMKSNGGLINILKLPKEKLQDIRGHKISMIMQEPSAALNPLYTIGEQVSEVLLRHRPETLVKTVLQELGRDIEAAEKKGLKFRARVYRTYAGIYQSLLKNQRAWKVRMASKIPFLRRYRRRLDSVLRREVVGLLKEMRIANPEGVYDLYPHELSGGMQQRAVIAMAIACHPRLLIADEPTTSLDVTVQAQILDLIRELKKEFGSSVLYITHNLGVVAEICDRVAVMYAGQVCEVAEVKELFKRQKHPYTRSLFQAIPRPGRGFVSIKGTVPNLVNPPPGCRFHPRCPKAMKICSKETPSPVEVRKNHLVYCHLYGGD
ncbi:MAG: ABC transporter ATP-binding protein [Candidatus Hadarchaeum sp.]|uniref:ABC transporter ATP-binding protein n=1 Tax=Candidatus Hadarchaeum sp. TaxID=2883567 RepID=UPI003D0CAB56